MSAPHKQCHTIQVLDAVINEAEGVFVFVAGGFGFGLRVLLGEAGGVPVLHGDDGVVGRGEGFFGADGVDPRVGGVFVGLAEGVEIGVLHKFFRLDSTEGKLMLCEFWEAHRRAPCHRTRAKYIGPSLGVAR